MLNQMPLVPLFAMVKSSTVSSGTRSTGYSFEFTPTTDGRIDSGDTPQVIGEASWALAQACFPDEHLDGGKGHDKVDVLCKWNNHGIVFLCLLVSFILYLRYCLRQASSKGRW